jgi:SAM-dependent methyltransferase
MARYSFGDDEHAVHRLGLVAEAYEPSSRAFLETHGPLDATLALDLGCGPGFSTRLLALTCRPRRIIGFDSSPQFLQSARERVPDAEFEEHDVALTPLPHAPAEMIYARLLLAHLPDPGAIVDGWRRQLAPGGTVLLEELEDIEAPAGPLRDYDDVSADIVRQSGGVMYAGPLLADLGGHCVRVTVSAATAAAIYLFNVRLWAATGSSAVSHERFVDLDAALARLVSARDDRPLSWIVRQLAVRA